MPLQLPNLDDRRYKDLVAEALTLIPTYSPTWTNHNPSDPGITFVEMFAWLTEMLVYRMNRVTNDNTLAFLKLLNGPDWKPPVAGDLLDEIRLSVLGIRERYRAVTAGDYEYLSTVSFNQTLLQSSAPAVDPIARAHCVPQRNLEAGSEADRLKLRPEHVSVVIVPFGGSSSPGGVRGQGPQPTAEQMSALFAYLDERRILTTKLHVTGPFYTHVSAQLVIARHPDVLDADLAAAIDDSLAALLNPLPADGLVGWPFGRDVFVSEIYETLEKIPGIDFVTDVMLTSKCSPTDNRCVVSDPIWHTGGDLIGLKLQDHHLPVFEQSQLTIAANSRFVIASLTVSAKTAPSADLAIVSRSIKSTVRDLLHPALGGPGPDAAQATDIFLRDVQVVISRIAGIVGPVSVIADCSPAETLQQDENRGPFLHVAGGDVLDWRVALQLS
jgi:hypothetical protein